MRAIVVALILLTMGCSHIKPHPRSWTTGEKAMAGFFIVAHAADAYTTERHQDYPASYEELNPLLGKHPTDSEIAIYFIATGAAALVICHFYPELRYPLLGIYGGVGMGAAWRNWKLIKRGGAR